MKALAVLAACLGLCAAAPASAFVHTGGGAHVVAVPHGGGLGGGLGAGSHGGIGVGSHGGFGGGFHHHGGNGLLPFLGGAYDVAIPSAPLVPDAAVAPDLPLLPPPLVIPGPVPACYPAQAQPQPHAGPHIIYIGHQPTIHGPKVIYGTD